MSHGTGWRRSGVSLAILCFGTSGCQLIGGFGDIAYEAGGGSDGGQSRIEAGDHGPDGASGKGPDGGREKDSASDDGMLSRDTGVSSHDSGMRSPDTGSESGACGACQLVAPAGWELVAFEESTADPCPAAFSGTDVVEPTGSGSCTCTNCSVTQNPDCESSTTMISMMWNVVGSVCDGELGYYPPSEGQCVAGMFGGGIGYMSVTAPPPVGGTCATSLSSMGPPTTAERFCVPSTCPADACAADLPAGFATCLYQAGDQACPGAAPTKHSVATSAGVSCSVCDCSVSASGCTGSMSFFSGPGCGGSPELSMTADGTCYNTSVINEGATYTYTATPLGVACNAGTSTATTTTEGPGTVCCP